MMPKGTVRPGAALANAFELAIPLIGSVTFTRIGALEQNLTTVVMADQTAQTTGKVEPVETEVEQYAHHGSEVLALDAWYAACKAGTPGHKTQAVLHMRGADNAPVKSFLLDGVLCKGRTIPEHDAAGDGEGQRFTWKLIIDNVIPL